MLINIINIIYPILALTAMILLARRMRIAFLLFLVVDVLMFYLGLVSGQFGISLMAVLYVFTNIYAYYKWSK